MGNQTGKREQLRSKPAKQVTKKVEAEFGWLLFICHKNERTLVPSASKTCISFGLATSDSDLTDGTRPIRTPSPSRPARPALRGPGGGGARGGPGQLAGLHGALFWAGLWAKRGQGHKAKFDCKGVEGCLLPQMSLVLS